jgi:hypothetical protein
MSIKTTITSNTLESAAIGDKTFTRRTKGGQVIYDGAGSAAGGDGSGGSFGAVGNADFPIGTFLGVAKATVPYAGGNSVGYNHLSYSGEESWGGDEGVVFGSYGQGNEQSFGGSGRWSAIIINAYDETLFCVGLAHIPIVLLPGYGFIYTHTAPYTPATWIGITTDWEPHVLGNYNGGTAGWSGRSDELTASDIVLMNYWTRGQSRNCQFFLGGIPPWLCSNNISYSTYVKPSRYDHTSAGANACFPLKHSSGRF